MGEVFERREAKFILTRGQHLKLEEKLMPHLSAEDYSRYTICNIFYDTPDFHLIRTSIERPPFKQKLRLRSYFSGGKQTDSYLELKKKLDHIVYKRRVSVENTVDPASLPAILDSCPEDQTLRELKAFVNRYPSLAPVLFLSCNRTAYVGKDNPDLRITFDSNIRWRSTQLDFVSGTAGTLLLPPGHCLLEIKTDHSIPLWLCRILDSCVIRKTTFSKVGRAYTQMLQQQNRTGA